jgi:putative CocE/NonD family hydrolase
VSHSNYDSYWKRLDWSDKYARFDFPVLHVGGWYDIFKEGTIKSFIQMRCKSTHDARDGQFLIMGPWIHNSVADLLPDSKQGDLDFGAGATMDLRELALNWLDHHVKGASEEVASAAPVRVFTMGENEWHAYNDWPVPETKFVNYYLHGNGAANSASGDGRLDTSLPKSEKPDRYQYDPSAPVPTVGGPNCCAQPIFPAGPKDQREVEKRQDILVYTSEPLETALRVTGPIKATLWMSSSVRDTDLTVKIVDVFPDGAAINLTDGILRLRYRNSFERAEFLEPGKIYKVVLDAGSTSNLFKVDHRIRVEISSSNFPRFTRNLNTVGDPELETEWVVAEQTIYHDESRPSYVTLPVLGLDQ